MKLLAPELLPSDYPLIAEIELDMKSIFRTLVFSPELKAADLLHRYYQVILYLRQILL